MGSPPLQPPPPCPSRNKKGEERPITRQNPPISKEGRATSALCTFGEGREDSHDRRGAENSRNHRRKKGEEGRECRFSLFPCQRSQLVTEGGEGFERKGRSGGEEREVMRNIGLLGMGT